MKNLISYFNVLLFNSTVSNNRIYTFGTDHLGKLRMNNPGQRYDSMIAATETVLSVFFQKAVDKDRSKALREGSTVNMNDVRNETENFIARHEGAIRSAFGKNSSIYQEFYPHGIKEYREASIDHFSDLLNMFIIAVEAHSAKLPTNLKTEILALSNEYSAARSQQVDYKGTVSGVISATDAAREAVCLQLTRNVLAIASDNLGKPDECRTYFNQSIVQAHHSAAGNEVIEGEPEPGEKYMVKQGGFVPETIFKIENDGSIALRFYTASDPGNNVPENATELLAGETVELRASQLGADGNTYLMCFNPSADNNGSFIAEVKERVK